jgi:hypothetical protein
MFYAQEAGTDWGAAYSLSPPKASDVVQRFGRFGHSWLAAALDPPKLIVLRQWFTATGLG